MNILYICHRVPYPPDKGDKIRSFHQIRHLCNEHTVHVACLIDDPRDAAHIKTLEKYCASVDAIPRGPIAAAWRALLALPTSRSLSVAAFYSGALQRRIDARLRHERFDRIIVYCSAMAQYVRRITEIPVVMDFVDVDSEKWRAYADYRPFPLSWLYRLEAGRLARYEQRIAASGRHLLVASEMEKMLLQSRGDGRAVSVIPNGVDLDYFTPEQVAPPLDNRPALVFTGVMDYFPNVDGVRYFCEEIFPLILKEVPEAQFAIVGRNPTRQVRALARHAEVIVTGSVADVRPFLAGAKVAVAPLRIARGVQNKVLEAMAMGLPVIGTSAAFQGMHATEADGIRIADEPEPFARAVVALLTNPTLQRRCALQSRQYVHGQHRWDDHGRRLGAVLQTIGHSTTTSRAG